MPIISVSDFEKRTSAGLRQGERFAAIVTCLKAYHRTPSSANLKALRTALDRWQGGHNIVGGARDSWKLDRRNQIRGKGHPIEELGNWVDRKLIEPALLALRDAAADVLKAYGDSMDHHYRGSLIGLFLGNPVDSVEPLYCMYYWDADALWQKRLNAIGAPPKTNAFCVPLTSAQKQGPGCATVRIKDDVAPTNRQIEFSSGLDHHDLFHELLHWCTHQTFETYTHGMADKMLGKFIREGLTEYLTRSGLSEWNKGGYIDFFPIWKELFDNGTVTLKDVILPYFHGVGVSAFCASVEPVITANQGYKDGKRAAFRAAFGVV
jgi:hypothetical protein